MRFYTKPHRYYCGIDLQARSMYVCILDNEGSILVHQNIKTCRKTFQNTVNQYNLPPLGCRLGKKSERPGVIEHFPDPVVRQMIALDIALIEHYDDPLRVLEQVWP